MVGEYIKYLNKGIDNDATTHESWGVAKDGCDGWRNPVTCIWSIQYVMDCLKETTSKVRNIKKYLLAALFNAPSTMKSYYQAEVNHDMPQFAVRAI